MLHPRFASPANATHLLILAVKIWSEGAIDNIGFEKGLNYWNRFLKKGGYIAVTCPSWLTDERHTEVEKFWADAGSRLDAIEYNI